MMVEITGAAEQAPLSSAFPQHLDPTCIKYVYRQYVLANKALDASLRFHSRWAQ